MIQHYLHGPAWIMRTVGECREIAEAYRQLAMRLTNPDDKHAVEMMTAAWTRIANERE
jgi:hypothetical protein